MLTGSSIYVDPSGCAVSATVLLARHGHHDEVGTVLSGRSEIGLSPTGRDEARRLAGHLRDRPLVAVYSSPRCRARRTAEAVADGHGLPVAVLDDLDEIDFGAWAGQDFAVLADDPIWQRWNARRATAATPAGDTMAATTARAVAAIGRVAVEGMVLCVSHCDVIRGVVAHVLGLSADRLLAFDVDCASLTTLAIDGGDWRLVGLNERPQ